MKDENTLIPIEKTNITDMIYTIRVKQVMIDRDLADLYQVQTKRLLDDKNVAVVDIPEYYYRSELKEMGEL